MGLGGGCPHSQPPALTCVRDRVDSRFSKSILNLDVKRRGPAPFTMWIYLSSQLGAIYYVCQIQLGKVTKQRDTTPRET